MAPRRGISAGLALLTLLLAGCLASPETGEVQDPAASDPAAGLATFPLPDVLGGLDAASTLDLGGNGNGVWVDEERALLYSSNAGAGVSVVDVRDPASPEILGLVDGIYARDVDMLAWEDRVLAVAAGGGEGLHVIDATDPRAPVLLFTASEHSVHNVASVPGTPYVYDATGRTDRMIPVLEILDAESYTWHMMPIPAVLNGLPVQSDGCHDITVRMDLGRAYCAGGGTKYAEGGGETFIWDISEDPLQPRWVSVIDNPFIVYHHQALPTEDGDLLLINDEFIAPNCHRVDVGPVLVQQPTAAMWVYDISDETSPQQVSYLQPPPPGDGGMSPANCGSHFGDLVDGSPAVVWGWYGGGTLLVDLSDPADPVILDQASPESSTWDARYWNGHVFGSSGQLQVFRIV